MKKYIIPETMLIVITGDMMVDLYDQSGSGDQLGNGGFFDDLDDELENSFKSKKLWDDENEAR